MRIVLVYDLRDDYRELGYSEEEIAEFDSVGTIDASLLVRSKSLAASRFVSAAARRSRLASSRASASTSCSQSPRG